MTDFYRIRRLPPYVFAEVNAMKAAARARGEDVVDLGMGNPDGAPPAHVIDKLAEVARNPRAHRYSASRGIAGLRKAQAAYYARRFGVEVDPEREVIVTLGSKEGLANLAQAITAPGRRRAGAQSLLPDPPVRLHHRRRRDPLDPGGAGAGLLRQPRAGGALHRAQAQGAGDRLSVQPDRLYRRPRLSTRQVVAFAREHDLWVISDLAYAEIYFGEAPTPSILQVEGAKEVAVEFTSMSKTYSMAGWRMGFAVGNAELVAALGRVKSYLDYGAFTPIQAAATAALNGPQDIVEANRRLYKARRDCLVESFGRAGWEIPPPQASMFAWAPIPEPFRALGSMEFAKRLLAEAQVAVSPGVGFGEEGEGFVRIALVENEQRIRQAARGVKRFLGGG